MLAVPPPPGQRPVALVVEDEPLIRLSTADMLDAMGFDVLEAGNADEALAILAARAPIAIVVTDMIMPGLRGSELGLIIRAKYPGTPVLIVSGMSGSEAIDQGFSRLDKPFGFNALQASVAALLGVAAPAGG